MPTVEEIKSTIVQTALSVGSVPPLLALAVCRKESGFDVYAVNSGSGAYGLFQLLPGAASDMGVLSSYKTDWQANILGGVKYLKWLFGLYPSGRLDLILAGYNWGVGNLNRLIHGSTSFPSLSESQAFPTDVLMAGVPSETSNYITRILAYMVEMQSDPVLFDLPDSQPSPFPEIQLSKALTVLAVLVVGLVIIQGLRD